MGLVGSRNTAQALRPLHTRPLHLSLALVAGRCLSLWARQVSQGCKNAAGRGPACMLSALKRVTDSYLAPLFMPALCLLLNSHNPISPLQKLEMGPAGQHPGPWYIF